METPLSPGALPAASAVGLLPSSCARQRSSPAVMAPAPIDAVQPERFRRRYCESRLRNLANGVVVGGHPGDPAEEFVEVVAQLLRILELAIGHVADLLELAQERRLDRGLL